LRQIRFLGLPRLRKRFGTTQRQRRSLPQGTEPTQNIQIKRHPPNRTFPPLLLDPTPAIHFHFAIITTPIKRKKSLRFSHFHTLTAFAPSDNGGILLKNYSSDRKQITRNAQKKICQYGEK
jgi:hypothetical protein